MVSKFSDLLLIKISCLAPVALSRISELRIITQRYSHIQVPCQHYQPGPLSMSTPNNLISLAWMSHRLSVEKLINIRSDSDYIYTHTHIYIYIYIYIYICIYIYIYTHEHIIFTNAQSTICWHKPHSHINTDMQYLHTGAYSICIHIYIDTEHIYIHPQTA